MFTGIIQSAGKIESLEFGVIGDCGAHGGALKQEGTAGTGANGARLRVGFAPDLIAASPLTLGASIAVNGCCLTVIESGNDFFVADLSPETLARTSFVEKKPGDPVNLERPLRVGDELGGHMVQGHVDGVGRVQSISAIENGRPAFADAGSNAGDNGQGNNQTNNWWLAVFAPAEIAAYIVAKGSLTVDGISLTVASWMSGTDSTGGVAGIAIIPFTYLHTNVRYLSPGDAVNLECDVLAKYAERFTNGVQAEWLLKVRAETDTAKAAPSKVTVERLTREGF